MFSAKFVVFALATLLLAEGAFADFRLASKPNTQFNVQNQNGAIRFTTQKAVYTEPATFGYQGLVNQRNNNNDNFLRSNVDNEQDNRNFNTEAGQDMLPFRTQSSQISGAPMTAAIGAQMTIPVRWNNPHSSECEVNIWIKGNTVVVPVKKPVCCGEGYQDAVIDVTIPADFNSLAAKVPGFTGCNKVGDCTMQIYAHSVEPRVYAVGIPLVLTGGQAISSFTPARDESQIAPMTDDPGMDISKQPRETCMAGSDPASNVQVSQPRRARLVSDVFNHAYQNSDYSPYSGQQQESISQNLQASSVIRMVATNGGELGRALLTAQQKAARNQLANKINNVVAKYEKAANAILNQYKDKMTGEIRQAGNQQLAVCNRCDMVSAVKTQRLQTATYIPSFPVPANLVANIQKGLGANAKSLVSSTNVAGIYRAAFEEVKKDLVAAAAQGMTYQPARLKTTTGTMADATKFQKLDAAGKRDKGVYAATQALKALAAEPKRAPRPYNAPPAAAAPKPEVVAPTPVDDEDVTPESFVAGAGLGANPDDVITIKSDDDDEESSASFTSASVFTAQAALAAALLLFF